MEGLEVAGTPKRERMCSSDETPFPKRRRLKKKKRAFLGTSDEGSDCPKEIEKIPKVCSNTVTSQNINTDAHIDQGETGPNSELATKMDDENEDKQKQESNQEKNIDADELKKNEYNVTADESKKLEDGVKKNGGDQVKEIPPKEKEETEESSDLSLVNRVTGQTIDMSVHSNEEEDVMAVANGEVDQNSKEYKEDITNGNDSRWGGDENMGLFGEDEEEHNETKMEWPPGRSDDAASESLEECDTSDSGNELEAVEDFYIADVKEDDDELERGNCNGFSPLTGKFARSKGRKRLRLKGMIESMSDRYSYNLVLDIKEYLKTYTRLKKNAAKVVDKLIPLLSYCSDKDISRLTDAMTTDKNTRQSVEPKVEVSNRNSHKQSSVSIKEPKASSKESLPSCTSSSDSKQVENSGQSSAPSNISQPLSVSEVKKVKSQSTDLDSVEDPGTDDALSDTIADFSPMCWSQILKVSRSPSVWTVEFSVKCFNELNENGHSLLKNPTKLQQKERFVYQLLTKTRDHWVSAVINERINEVEEIISAGWPVDFPLLSNRSEVREWGLPKRDASLYNSPALLIASSYGFEKSVQSLLLNGANLEARNEFSCENALFHACKYGHLHITKLLLVWKADPNSRTSCSTAVNESVSIGFELVTNKRINNRVKILGELIFYGAATYDMNQRNILEDQEEDEWPKDFERYKDLIRVCAIEKEMESLEMGLNRRFDFIAEQLLRYTPMLSDTIISFLNPLSCTAWTQVSSDEEDVAQDEYGNIIL